MEMVNDIAGKVGAALASAVIVVVMLSAIVI